MTDLFVEEMTEEAFAPFGDLLQADGPADMMINQGRCGRYHDRAQLEFVEARAGISLFQAEPCTLPLTLEMVERHPLGSQAFVPMTAHPFLVIVAPDQRGQPDMPGVPRVFETRAGQGVNLHRGVWHGVLTPLFAPGLFAVVDRIGTGNNLQEHWFAVPYCVRRRAGAGSIPEGSRSI